MAFFDSQVSQWKGIFLAKLYGPLKETGNAEWSPCHEEQKEGVSRSSGSGKQMSAAGHWNVSPVWPEYQLLWVASFQQRASLTKQEIEHLFLYQAINYYLHRLLAAGTQSEMFCSCFRLKLNLHFIYWSPGLPAWTAVSEMYSSLGK